MPDTGSPVQLSLDELNELIEIYNSELGHGSYVKSYNFIKAIADKNAERLGTGTVYWYDNAPLINDPAVGSPVKDFIREATLFGLAWDHQTVPGDPADPKNPPTQPISNAIAEKVIGDIINHHEIPTVNTLIGNDIGVAIDKFHQTLGGWGGDFYYWNFVPQGWDETIGQRIQKDPAEYEKFLADTAYNVYAQFGQAGAALISGNLPEAKTRFRGIGEGLDKGGPELPPAVLAEIGARVFDIAATGNVAGNPATINGWDYQGANPASDTGQWQIPDWVPDGPPVSPLIMADPALARHLDLIRRIRLDHQDMLDRGVEFSAWTAPGQPSSAPGKPGGIDLNMFAPDERSQGETYQARPPFRSQIAIPAAAPSYAVGIGAAPTLPAGFEDPSTWLGGSTGMPDLTADIGPASPASLVTAYPSLVAGGAGSLPAGLPSAIALPVAREASAPWSGIQGWDRSMPAGSAPQGGVTNDARSFDRPAMAGPSGSAFWPTPRSSPGSAGASNAGAGIGAGGQISSHGTAARHSPTAKGNSPTSDTPQVAVHGARQSAKVDLHGRNLAAAVNAAQARSPGGPNTGPSSVNSAQIYTPPGMAISGHQ
jgi:hypothetical protein